MDITYTEEKRFTQAEVEVLFLSVNWVSGRYPARLHRALQNSSTVITAWAGDQLVGLTRLLDDSCMTAFMHYVLVHPDYQAHGIASQMMRLVKEKYKDYLYIDLMPEERKNARFYQKHGFEIMPDGIALSIINKAPFEQ
ncbi:MAG: GNAT family N-acetyltransferase [Akkermansia sp.]